jgi:hypothetical protein
MLKALIKSLEKTLATLIHQILDPLNPWTLGPSSPIKLEKSLIYKQNTRFSELTDKIQDFSLQTLSSVLVFGH